MGRTCVLVVGLSVGACTADDTSDRADTDRFVADTDDTDPEGVETDGTDASHTDETDAPHTDETDDTDDGPVLPLPGFGALTGACGVLDAGVWGSADPRLFRAAYDFGSAAYDPSLMSAGAREILDEGTLGGSSVASEALAFDFLFRCEGAALTKSESEIGYTSADSKKTDMLVQIDGLPVGVSVTRALTFAFPEPCATPDTEALASLVARKVGDLPLSQAGAVPTDVWDRSVLAVVACDADHADAVEAAFGALDAGVKGDAILLLVHTDGEDAFLY